MFDIRVDREYGGSDLIRLPIIPRLNDTISYSTKTSVWEGDVQKIIICQRFPGHDYDAIVRCSNCVLLASESFYEGPHCELYGEFKGLDSW